MHGVQELYEELVLTLAQVDMQIKHIKNDIAREYPEEKRSRLNVWYWTKGEDGKYILADLINSRATLLSQMAALRVYTP